MIYVKNIQGMLVTLMGQGIPECALIVHPGANKVDQVFCIHKSSMFHMCCRDPGLLIKILSDEDASRSTSHVLASS
jgi:hypothetical protein